MVAEWETENGRTLVALAVTKDVQDSILNDPIRSKIVDIIDIEQWYNHQKGQYAPPGGMNMAPRQYMRKIRGGSVRFDDVYRAVAEYRTSYPDKAVIYSAQKYPEMGWAALMAGGSCANVPVNDKMFLRDITSMKPQKIDDNYLLQGDCGYVVYKTTSTPLSLPLASSSTYKYMQIDAKTGDILTEGYATENGELALGRNLLVAYIPWKGYNYEDAVVISERMVRDDVLTSVHVDEYSLDVRETKRGVEEFTSDIPNVSEEATKDLDDNGIVRVGARIEPGDIMIGKISPKGESDPSPEEKLLRAIFGDKAGDVKDSSLKANPSLSGVVIDKKLFSRAVKTRESKKQDKIILAKIDEEYEAKGDDLKDILVDKLLTLTEGKTSEGVKDYTGAEIITKGSKFTATALKNLEYDGVQSNGWTDDDHTNGLIQRLIMNYIRKYKQLDAELKRRKFAITIGDELPSGILQMAKVYIAKKRKIQVGDKLAGRHGNKGIVSKVVRLEDMPFMADGRPVDMVLNPLGVPSRMNLGQIFECILGAAGKKLGVKFATPIFDGAKLEDLSEWTDKAGLPRFCSTYLYDGETGEQFDQPATVGMTYFLKLGHMVEDKMHARSIGPYSLITQQPLGGKAQFGGQRFGEMEVWAIEAFGASHVLQEILTIKSDDVVGRSKAYEAIVKGDPMPTPGIPESLNVLLHELRGLGLSIKLD